MQPLDEITFFQLSVARMAFAYSEAIATARRAWGENSKFNVNTRHPTGSDANGMVTVTLVELDALKKR
jgi:hypothetical protein